MTAKKKSVGKQKEISGWKIKHLSDAFLPRPLREYAVDGLFAFSTLNVIFGAEGSMKSLLMMDMGICISEGLPWLPHEDNTTYKFKTTKCNVLYVDCDNGSLTDDERINAFALSHGLSADDKSAFTYISMPEDFDISNDDSVNRIDIICQALNIRVLFLDNLGLINSKDENSHEMAKVMSNLRKLANKGLCVIVVHHQKKSNGESKIRLGEMLRGHSSIAASLDFSYFVSRKDLKENDILIIPTKARFAPPETFGARFVFKWINGSKELETAIFINHDALNEFDKAVGFIPLVIGDRELPKTEFTRELMDKGVSQSIARKAISQCVDDGRLTQKTGKHNTQFLKWNEENIITALQEAINE